MQYGNDPYCCIPTVHSGYIHTCKAKQKHPGYKKSARPIRSSIAKQTGATKNFESVEAKKLLIKNLLNYLNDIHTIVYSIFSHMIGFVTWPPLLIMMV